ncbi:aldehyde dehydrogenase family protein, partial [Tropicibacter naphthalenivorans]
MTLDANIAKAKGYIAHFAETGVLNHIDGASVPAASGKTFETISPVDLTPLAKVAKGGAEDIDAAVAAAKKAFPAWSKTPGAERR